MICSGPRWREGRVGNWMQVLHWGGGGVSEVKHLEEGRVRMFHIDKLAHRSL